MTEEPTTPDLPESSVAVRDVWTVRDGKLWRLRIFHTREETPKAVGLEQ